MRLLFLKSFIITSYAFYGCGGGVGGKNESVKDNEKLQIATDNKAPGLAIEAGQGKTYTSKDLTVTVLEGSFAEDVGLQFVEDLRSVSTFDSNRLHDGALSYGGFIIYTSAKEKAVTALDIEVCLLEEFAKRLDRLEMYMIKQDKDWEQTGETLLRGNQISIETQDDNLQKVCFKTKETGMQVFLYDSEFEPDPNVFTGEPDGIHLQLREPFNYVIQEPGTENMRFSLFNETMQVYLVDDVRRSFDIVNIEIIPNFDLNFSIGTNELIFEALVSEEEFSPLTITYKDFDYFSQQYMSVANEHYELQDGSEIHFTGGHSILNNTQSHTPNHQLNSSIRSVIR